MTVNVKEFKVLKILTSWLFPGQKRLICHHRWPQIRKFHLKKIGTWKKLQIHVVTSGNPALWKNLVKWFLVMMSPCSSNVSFSRDFWSTLASELSSELRWLYSIFHSVNRKSAPKIYEKQVRIKVQKFFL